MTGIEDVAENSREPPQEAPETSSDAEKKAPPQSCYFCAVVQADFSTQMDVFRWLIRDKSYCVVAILHDRDKYTADEIPLGTTKTRTNGDGSQSVFKMGDIKPAHYHIMLKLPHKTTAKALSKRFCKQVNFQLCGDRWYYAAYLTHSTFDSQQKAQYSETELIFSDVTAMPSVNFYQNCRVDSDMQSISAVKQAIEFVESMAKAGGGCDAKDLVQFAIDNDNTVLLRQIMSHAYFYKSFILGKEVKK